MMPRSIFVLVLAVMYAAAQTAAPISTAKAPSSSSSTSSSMVPCSSMVIQTATKRLFSDRTSPLTACAQSLDLLPNQYLDLERPTATHCRLLVNNTHCSAFNDAYNAAMMSISPVCLLSPTQPSSVPKPYDAFVMDWCRTRMTAAPPN
ncbi:hypothetical protein H257_18679, partial [Aphanomyces astaci]